MIFRRLIFLAWAAACLGACANRLPPVSKLVNDRRIVTRSVNASASARHEPVQLP